MDHRRQIAIVLILTYVVALIGLIVARYVLLLSPTNQFIIATAAATAVGVVASTRPALRRFIWGWRTGRAAVMNGVVLLVAFVTILSLREMATDTWPIIAIALGLPAFLSLQFAIGPSRLSGTHIR